MRICESKFGLVRGREIQQLIQDATGQNCPCVEGRPCPLGRRTKDAERIIIANAAVEATAYMSSVSAAP